MLIEGMDYLIRYIPLPISVHGMTVLDENGFYNVYINICQSREVQLAALEHEMEHIKRNDFSRDDEPLEVVENMS